MPPTPELPHLPHAPLEGAAPAMGVARLNAATLGAQNIIASAAPIAGLVLGGVIAYQGLKTIVTGKPPWPLRKE